jgi:hypothetical protein
MAETKRQPRESISTRIDADAHAVIEKIAEQRRTTAAQVARILLEDGAKELGRNLCAEGCTHSDPNGNEAQGAYLSED